MASHSSRFLKPLHIEAADQTQSLLNTLLAQEMGLAPSAAERQALLDVLKNTIAREGGHLGVYFPAAE
jgi:hypothetical protein